MPPPPPISTLFPYTTLFRSPKGTHSWEDIDPTVLTDDDGTTWIAWGNRQCYIARLKPNMIEIDGPITEITRSEEHTSELQSRRDLVCRLLLEKKKKKKIEKK